MAKEKDSHFWIRWVARHSRTTGTERLVLMCLADRADYDGRAWPSVETMAEFAGTDVRWVRRLLKSLEEKDEIGLLERGGGRNKTNIYCINLREETLVPKPGFNSNKPWSTLQGLAPKREKLPQQSKTLVPRPSEGYSKPNGKNGSLPHGDAADNEPSPFL